MTGATRRDFLNLITLERAGRPKMSKWVRATFDKLERAEFVKSRDALFFDDQAFLDRQMPEAKMRSLLVLQEAKELVSCEHFAGQLAKAWGFDDVEEFEAFVAAGGCQSHPEYYRGVEHLQGGKSDPRPSAAPVDGRAATGPAIRAPDWFDRQGRPQWGPEGREYLAGAFAREAAGQTGQFGPSGGLQEDTTEE